MATKITTDSVSPTSVSYKWSIVTFSLSRTVFVIMGFPLSAPKIGGFAPKLSQNGKVSHRPPNGTSMHGNTCFRTLGAEIWRAVRPERVEKKVCKKKLNKPQVVYISPHRPDDAERGVNLKLNFPPFVTPPR